MLRIAYVSWLGIANAHIVILLTGGIASEVDVAQLKVSLQFSALMMIGLSAVEAVQAPLFSRFHELGSIERIRQLMVASSRLSLLIALPVSIVLVLFAEELLEFLFSND